jgi:hypothetical protein
MVHLLLPKGDCLSGSIRMCTAATTRNPQIRHDLAAGAMLRHQQNDEGSANKPHRKRDPPPQSALFSIVY